MFGTFLRSYSRHSHAPEGGFSGDYYDPEQSEGFTRQNREPLKAVGLVNNRAAAQLETLTHRKEV